MTDLNLTQAKEDIRAIFQNGFGDQQFTAITESKEYLSLHWESHGVCYSMDFLNADLSKWRDEGNIKGEVESRIRFAISNKKLPENNPNAPESIFL